MKNYCKDCNYWHPDFVMNTEGECSKRTRNAQLGYWVKSDMRGMVVDHSGKKHGSEVACELFQPKDEGNIGDKSE